MKKVIFECDYCGKDFHTKDGGAEIEFWFGTYQDPCEGTKSNFEELDFCRNCMIDLAKRSLQKLPENERENLYLMYKRGKT